jgi:hypothetical protein
MDGKNCWHGGREQQSHNDCDLKRERVVDARHCRFQVVYVLTIYILLQIIERERDWQALQARSR